ncbi:MAG TPA: tyrosine-type recombinase/integrase [Candidatus Tumulicola sp.]
MKKKARKVAHIVQVEGYDDPLGIGGRFVTTQERQSGTGSIDRVTIKGEEFWRARYWMDDAKGVRVRKALYAKSESKVLQKLSNLRKTPTASRDAKKLTLEQYLTHHFLPGIEQQVRLNTFSTYDRACRNHIIPRIGKARLVSFTPSNANAWTAELAADETGARATQQAFMVLKRALGYAVTPLGLLERNPLSEMHAPRADKKTQHILGLDEVGKLLKAAQQTDWYVLILLAIATSMRQGELFGLQWKHVKLPEGYLRVVESLLIGRQGEPYLAAPKTEASKRRVELSPMLVQVLTDHKARQTDNPLGLVFPAAKGGFIRKDNFRRDVWVPLLEAAELPSVTFHSLRHAGNSLLVSRAGVSLKVAQERLGHETRGVTFDVYTHLEPGESKRAAAQMDKLLNRSGGLVTGLVSSSKGSKPRPKAKKKD